MAFIGIFLWPREQQGKQSLLVSFSVKSFYKLRLEFRDIDDFLFNETFSSLRDSRGRLQKNANCLRVGMEFLCEAPASSGECEKAFGAASDERDAPCSIDGSRADRIAATFSLCSTSRKTFALILCRLSKASRLGKLLGIFEMTSIRRRAFPRTPSGFHLTALSRFRAS